MTRALPAQLPGTPHKHAAAGAAPLKLAALSRSLAGRPRAQYCQRNTICATMVSLSLTGEAAAIRRRKWRDDGISSSHETFDVAEASPIIAASTPPSLRAQRSNPGATARGPWIASSQGLLAMTVNGGVRVLQVDFLVSGLRPRRLIDDVAPGGEETFPACKPLKSHKTGLESQPRKLP